MNEMIRRSLTQLLDRDQDTHKGSCGHILIVAGSPGMTGAAFFAGMGALRCGAGLVCVAVPQSLNPVMEVKLSEALTLPLPETHGGMVSLEALDDIVFYLERCDSLALGPGLSLHPETKDAVHHLVEDAKVPVVLDADGLNAYQGNVLRLKSHLSELVITPHPGEIARLLNIPIADVQEARHEVAREFAETYCCVVVLKGHETLVYDPEGAYYVNETGNPGMATGGMGDILTGMIASLLGQGLESYEAATLAVYLHGRAGDLAAQQRGALSLLPSDVLNHFTQELWSV